MGYVYFTDDQKQRANAVDLEDFLNRQGEKLLKSGREKRLASDHSITVWGNEWYDHAVEKGGCAIDFVQMFYGRSFPDAVTMLLNGEQGQSYRPSEQRQPEPPKPFVLPEANKDMRRVFAYLTKTRCLDREVVSAFAHAKLIYEDAKYHNAVFVGCDADGVARHAHKRGTYTQGEPFKGNVDGCDPRYSFHYTGQSDTVYVFEAPIDMLSFISLYQKDWKQHSYVSLCGVAEHALVQLLSLNPQVKKTGLCLDNDKAGLKARIRLTDILAEREYGEVFSLLPKQKDWNEDLQKLKQQQNMSQVQSTETTLAYMQQILV
ncbi:DUF3991 and toprim domain-containing protein [Enterocloster bolteae]|uniref:DUF3991 and toprim domain-containing protein n=1 Tax=Enterocloster bolteae TaxID=208479 RepID=UPI00210D822F|nr:DUF3991 and toprim domain-containing protein [Enterocloster bolteae]MCQ5144466.1 DUF3991 and toprim domain-containing protein [Enterocloster bolteae]